jgi:uncharacterized membrane protein (DUF106 family)
MGLFDLPAPLLSWLDGQLALVLPPFWRVVVWGGLSAALSMGLYRRLSQQKAIARVAVELAESRQELSRYQGDFQGLKPRLGRMLRLSLRQVRLTFLPAVAASVPLLFLFPWLGPTFNSETYLPLSPRWLQSAEALYILVLVACSLLIRITFKIR